MSDVITVMMNLVVLFGLAVGILKAMEYFEAKLLKSHPELLSPELGFHVSVDGVNIVVRQSKNRVSSMAVAELKQLSVVTNSSGPLGIDAWWSLVGYEANSELFFPVGAEGDRAFISFAEALGGFDGESFRQAMASSNSARFLCWQAHA